MSTRNLTLVILAVIAISVASYAFLHKESDTASNVPESIAYHSDVYGIAFAYPQAWAVEEKDQNIWITDSLQDPKTSVPEPRDLVFVSRRTPCEAYDWKKEDVSGSTASEKNVCRGEDVSVYLYALSDASKAIEDRILGSFSE
jgi:hypothetical protein